MFRDVPSTKKTGHRAILFAGTHEGNSPSPFEYWHSTRKDSRASPPFGSCITMNIAFRSSERRPHRVPGIETPSAAFRGAESKPLAGDRNATGGRRSTGRSDRRPGGFSCLSKPASGFRNRWKARNPYHSRKSARRDSNRAAGSTRMPGKRDTEPRTHSPDRSADVHTRTDRLADHSGRGRNGHVHCNPPPWPPRGHQAAERRKPCLLPRPARLKQQDSAREFSSLFSFVTWGDWIVRRLVTAVSSSPHERRAHSEPKNGKITMSS